MQYVYVLISQNKCNYYVVQTLTSKKEKKKDSQKEWTADIQHGWISKALSH